MLGLVIYSVAAVSVAGAIKGFVGLGFPTASMGLLTLVLPPRVAVAMILLPMLFSNLWQFLRAGDVRGTIRRHWRFALILAVGVALISYTTQDVEDRLLLAVLGVAILLFVVLHWIGAVPQIPPERQRPFEFLSATASAVIGGLTTGWAAPMSAYLIALRVPPAEFIRATGFMISAGSLPLCLSYLQLGHMSGSQALISAALVLPTLLGFALGEGLRHRVSAAQFRSALLWVFLGLGLNLIYRAATSA